MSMNNDSPTPDFLDNTRSVLNAGRQLLDAIEDGEDLQSLNYAITQLESASDAQARSSQSYRTFKFSETAEVAQQLRADDKEQVLEDVLAGVLTDLQVGNVLLSAGQSVGESGREPRPELLSDALVLLGNTAATLEAGEVAGPRRFNFVESAVAREVVQSVTVEEAIERYRQRATEALDAFVSETHSVTVSILEALKKLNPSDVLKALEGLGAPIKSAVGIAGGLINKGLDKIKTAIETLVKFVGNDAMTKIKVKLGDLWQEALKGNLAQTLLAKMLGVGITREAVRMRLDKGDLDRSSLDEGSNTIELLVTTYNNNMRIAKNAVSAITFAGGIMAFVPALGAQNAALFAGVGYCTVLAAVLLIGMDYADSGRVLRRVRGVGEVTNELRSVTP